MKKFVTVLAAMILFGWGAGAIQAQDWTWTWEQPILVKERAPLLEEISADPTSDVLYILYGIEDGSAVRIILPDPAPVGLFELPDASTTVKDIVVDPKGQAFVCTEDQVKYVSSDMQLMPLVAQPLVPTNEGGYTHITAGYGGKLFVLYQTTTDPVEQYILVGSPPVITDGVAISFKPRSLNLKSRGRWVSCHIGLADPHDATDIDPDKVTINAILIEGFAVDPYVVSIGVDPAGPMEVEDGKLKVKFKRRQVTDAIDLAIQALPTSDVGKFVKATLTVQGGLASGEYFQGTDTIKVKTGKRKK